MRLTLTLPMAALAALACLSCSSSSTNGSSGGSNSSKGSSSGSAGNSGSGSSSGQSLGEECGGPKACVSGLTCIGELPGGYCSAPCNPAACPSGGSCIEALPGEFACGLACTGDADCTRLGYACDPTCQVCIPAIAVGQVSCPPNFAGGGGHLPDGGTCGSAPAAGQLDWTPSVDSSASAASASEVEGAGAASPLDAGYVVVAYELSVLEGDDAGPSGSIGVSVSNNEGKTFAVAPPLYGPGDSDVDAYDPAVGVDAFGKFYLSWGAFDGNGVGHVWLATSYDARDGGVDGLGWTTPQDILGPTGFAGGGIDKPVFSMNPSIAMVPYGAYVVMGTFLGSFGGGGPYQIQLVPVIPGGLNWDPMVEVDDSPSTQRNAWRDLPAIDFDASGNAYVAWVEYNGAQGEQIVVDDQVVGAEIVGYSGASIWFSLVQYQLGGAVPGKNVQVSVPDDNVVLDVPKIVAAPDGSTLYAVYTASSSSGAPSVTNILLATSTDQGTNWTVSATPVNAGLSDAADCSTNFHPAAFLDSQNRLWVSWVSNIDGAGSVLYAVSSDQGVTFSTPAPVSDQPFSFNTQLGIPSSLGGYQSLFGGNGQLFSVWAGAPTTAGGFPPSHVFVQEAALP